MNFFINDALAAAPAALSTTTTQHDSTFSMIMIAAIFVLFYFMLIRPQNKRAKEHKNLINQLNTDDEVVTSGGIIGKIVTVNEQFIKLNLTNDVNINLQRQAISAVLPKGTIKNL